MGKNDDALDVGNPAYIGTDPMYQNHANDCDAPLDSDNEVLDELAQRGKDYEAAAAVKSVDHALEGVSVGVTDPDTGEPVESEAPATPSLTDWVAERDAARLGDVSAGDADADVQAYADAYDKETLVEMADEAGVSHAGTKYDIAARLLGKA